MLVGNKDTVEAYHAAMNKKISDITVSGDKLTISFDDKSKLVIRDDGQSCCELRYMVCDDDLSHYIGAVYRGCELLPVEELKCESDEHEVQFLKINTSNGFFKIANHNEHNGYYGGFSIELRFYPGA